MLYLANWAFTQSTIPNNGFETWTNTEVKDSLEFWQTSTVQYAQFGVYIDNAVSIGNAQDGALAMHLETVVYQGDGYTDTLFGFMVAANASDDFIGFPYNDNIDALNGFYKNNHVVGDSAMIIVQLQSNGNVFSYTEYKISGNHPNWTAFNIPLNNAVLTPDSVFIGFISSDPFQTTNPQPGSWIDIDNISFSSTGGNTPAAIPNHSFESHIKEFIELPDNWWSFNEVLYLISGTECVTKSTDAFEGNYSLKLSTTQASIDQDLFSIFTNGQFNFAFGDLQGGIPFSAQPTELKGRYKFESPANDSAYILVEMFLNGSNFLTDFSFLPTSSFWTPFNMQLNPSQAPDSVRITFFSSEELGANLWLDDLNFFGGDVGLEENTSVDEINIYPNPANYYFNLQTKAAGTFSVFDLSGKLIESIQTIAQLTTINTTSWQSGYYLITFQTENGISKQKISIVK